MSLKSILKSIGHFISKIWKGLGPELKKAVKMGVEIVDAIKAYDAAHPGIADIITDIIPGHWDDAFKEKARASFADILTQLRLVEAAADTENTAQIISEAIKVLQSLPKGLGRSNLLNGLAIGFGQALSDGKLTWDEGALLVKYVHDYKEDQEIDTEIE